MTNFPLLELDAASYPEWRERLLAAEAAGAANPGTPRSYPGYPRWPLLRLRPRWLTSLDRVLTRRRCLRHLNTTIPSKRTLSRLLLLSHGLTGPLSTGPVPSAGGLQALELYLVVFESDWLPAGAYHYDRVGHHLSQLAANASRADWHQWVVALDLVQGGSLLWIVVGEAGRVRRKYGERAERFLLQESGHLLQNLCLLSTSLGLTTVPLGGYFEGELARQLTLLPSDLVLSVGVCGRPLRQQ